MDNAMPSMSRLPREPKAPSMSGSGKEGMKSEEKTGDHMHAAAESMHQAEPHKKHMVVSHDGFEAKSHSVDEQGNHEEHEGDDATDHVNKFMGSDEGTEEHDGGEEPEENSGNLY
jgi:hypothetical protein